MNIDIGALAPRLADQITAAGGIITDPTNLAHLQQDADAINRLYVRNYLSDSAAHRARQRMIKQLSKCAQEASQ